MPPIKFILRGGKRPTKANKFNRKRVSVDGIWFDSKAEAAHYNKLKLLVKARVISDLQCHPKFPLVINGKPVGRYTPDFSFLENGKRVFQDVKNPITKALASFRIKVFEALYDTKVEIVSKSKKKFVPFLGYVDESVSDDEAKAMRSAAQQARAANRISATGKIAKRNSGDAGRDSGRGVGTDSPPKEEK
jgi:hypothetical protein